MKCHVLFLYKRLNRFGDLQLITGVDFNLLTGYKHISAEGNIVYANNLTITDFHILSLDVFSGLWEEGTQL